MPIKVQASRASGANTTAGTYFSSTGTLTTAPINYFTYSENLASGFNIPVSISVTNNVVAAPSGSQTAASIIENTATTDHYAEATVTASPNQVMTASIYIKAAGRTSLLMRVFDGVNVVNAFGAAFNLATGTKSGLISGGTGVATDYTITSLPNSWYRITITGTPAVGSVATTVKYRVWFVNASTTYTGDGVSGFYVWGAQLEAGTTATAPIYTNGAAAYGPRLDYDPGNCSAGTCAAKGLLIEQARTNLVTNSAIPLPTGTTAATLTASAVIRPDGGTASKLVEDSSNTRHYASLIGTITASTANTYSIFAKAGERTSMYMYAGKWITPFTRGGMIVNLSNGTFSNSDFGTPLSVTNRMVTSVGNGWYRISMTVVIDTTSTDGYIEVGPYNGALSYLGNGTSGLYFWGAQIEQGSSVTSYIPTNGTAITRNADDVRVHDMSWYTANNGTFAGKAVVPYSSYINSYAWLFSLSNGVNSRYGIFLHSTNIATNISSGGSTLLQFGNYSFALSSQTPFYFSSTYINGDYSLGAANTLVTDSSAVALPAINQLRLGTDSGTFMLDGWLQTFQYYSQRLSNSQIQDLSNSGQP